MPSYNREDMYIKLLSEKEYTVKELSEKLFVSEPTVRRDVVKLKEKELVTCKRGMVQLKVKYADQRIPLFIRNMENNEAKKAMARYAAEYIKDGDVIMLDGSTSAYYVLFYLQQFKNIMVITSGAKTAVDSAAMGIKTICCGGEMAEDTFSYIGADAEAMLERYNADIAFFSCRGLCEGVATDTSIYENSIRKIMIKNSKKSVLLCDESKMGKKYLNTLCYAKDIDAIITERN